MFPAKQTAIVITAHRSVLMTVCDCSTQSRPTNHNCNDHGQAVPPSVCSVPGEGSALVSGGKRRSAEDGLAYNAWLLRSLIKDP